MRAVIRERRANAASLGADMGTKMADPKERSEMLKRLNDNIKGHEDIEECWPSVKPGVFDAPHLPSELQHIRACLQEGSYIIPPTAVASAIMDRLGIHAA
jgi:hypothetical protein